MGRPSSLSRRLWSSGLVKLSEIDRRGLMSIEGVSVTATTFYSL